MTTEPGTAPEPTDSQPATDPDGHSHPHSVT